MKDKCDGCFYCNHSVFGFGKNGEIEAQTKCLLCNEVVTCDNSCVMHTKKQYTHTCLDCSYFDITCKQCAIDCHDLERFEKFNYANNCCNFELDFKRYFKKQPIGIKPLYVLLCERVSELSKAIDRYSCDLDIDENRKYVKKWSNEIISICNFMESFDN